MSIEKDIRELFIAKLPIAQQEATYELADWIKMQLSKAGPIVAIHAVELVHAQLRDAVEEVTSK